MMPSDKFRHQLHQEAKQWRTEGLIDASVYEQLAQRYQFHELQNNTRNRFIVLLLVLGCILLGLGLITFIAANWQGWSRELKGIVLLTIFGASSITGFSFWRQAKNRWQNRLGRGFLILGSISLGANIALMSQLFHQSQPVYQLYLLWGLGVLIMAYSLGLTMLGLGSCLLIGIGYIQAQGQPDYLVLGELSGLRLMIDYMPVVAGLLFIPLAHRCHSRWIFRIGAIAVIYTLEADLLRLNLLVTPAWIGAIACALPPALLWGYRSPFWGKTLHTKTAFHSTAKTLTLIFFSILFYVLSFYAIWNVSFLPSTYDSSIISNSVFVNIFLLGGWTIWEWCRLLRHWDGTTTLIAIMIVSSGLVPYWHLTSGKLAILAVLIFNALLLVLALGLIRQGLTQVQRRLFWGGIILLTLQIVSRMLEYKADLLFKSFVFFLCGLAIIAAGLFFERYIRNR